jgi:hypothetical protein
VKKVNVLAVITEILILIVIFIACSKGGEDTAPDPCNGISITVTGNISNPTTSGGSNGSLSVSATGGSGFTYNLNGGTYQASGVFTGLSAGTYTIIAKTNNNCTKSAVFILTDPPNLCSGVNIVVSGNSTNPTSPGATNGSISASATGSTGFTFNINGGLFQANGNFNNLGAGTYTVVAKDVNGCTGSGNFTLTEPNQCSGVTIVVTNTVSGNTPCGPANGSISAAATGGTGAYTFSRDGINFQASGTFNNLSAGTYTITAKDGNNCTGSVSVTVSNLPAGSLFSAVKSLIQTNCVSCHNNAQQNGGMNWEVDCNIVTFKDRIKARAVDANPSSMPPTGLLPASERQKITNWINAGGSFTD